MKKLTLAILALLATNTLAQPLKVYILAGQSNMEGHAEVRTFDHVGMGLETAPLLRQMRNADGTPRICEKVFISYRTEKDTVKQGPLTIGYGALGRELLVGSPGVTTPEVAITMAGTKQQNAARVRVYRDVRVIVPVIVIFLPSVIYLERRNIPC